LRLLSEERSATSVSTSLLDDALMAKEVDRNQVGDALQGVP